VVLGFRDGSVRTAKVLSLLDTVGSDIAGLAAENEGDDRVDAFVHATTVCSNALIERTLPRIGFITTNGFRYTLEMMGQRGPAVMDLDWERAKPLVPLSLCFEVDERVLADGSVDRALAAGHLRQVLGNVLDEHVTCVAVSLINSYVNPVHEQQIKDALADLAPSLPICLSSDINPEIQEFERASSTVINAALIPVVNDYLDKLQLELNRFTADLRIMQSNGGTMSAEVARKRPMTMVESGPAAGVLAAACVARELSLAQVLSFDMGGTTAKTCLIEHGSPVTKTELAIGGSIGSRGHREAGFPLRTPSLDIAEVGAGGGSIAWIDAAGALRVGPRSAGAEPGPACYGRGGEEPTITDANVALGYINPAAIADSAIAIDHAAALRAIDTYIATPLGLGVYEAAAGIVEVANATMMRALRAVSTERGRDIRDFTLLGFGGSGPVHAVPLAAAVGIERVVIPPLPGVLSALGLLLAGDRLDYVHSVEQPIDSLRDADVRAACESMIDLALADVAGQRITRDDLSVVASADISYRAEPHALNVPFDYLAQLDPATWAENFRQLHRQEYGFVGDGAIHVARIRLQVSRPSGRLNLADLVVRGRPTGEAGAGPNDHRNAYFSRSSGPARTPVLDRWQLTSAVSGPVIIEEPTTTIVVPPGWTAQSDPYGNLVITAQGSNGGTSR
jgi:N-methylhydantoinase A